jgi:hypothetical protein
MPNPNPNQGEAGKLTLATTADDRVLPARDPSTDPGTDEGASTPDTEPEAVPSGSRRARRKVLGILPTSPAEAPGPAGTPRVLPFGPVMWRQRGGDSHELHDRHHQGGNAS